MIFAMSVLSIYWPLTGSVLTAASLKSFAPRPFT